MSTTDGRPTSAEPERRGSFRIFLGCAPGVGKTYEMLTDARALIGEGVDTVIGVVESHGRADTAALLSGIEVVPRTVRRHRGVELAEMDLDAVLRRRPALVLVDELAHSNAPGGRHAKRWQDIQEILDAGIDVLSTVNIQHLESLNDVVQQITGTQQQETVPDDVVRAADQIELVDISPEALQQRLRAGKVYPNDRVVGALANYFRRGNITALRELALLWLADRVEESLADYRAAHEITDTWETRERVVVAITGGSESATLMRRASRIASRSSAELVVVHVVRGDGLLDPHGADMVESTAMAGRLGAQVHTVVGDDVAVAMLDFARGMNATQLVIGTSRRTRWQRFVDEGVGARVLRMSGSIDVHMVTHDQGHRDHPLDIRGSRFHRPLSWVFAVVVPVLATAVIALLDRWLGFASETAMFFVVVVVISLLGGVGPAALSAVASGLLLNYFFTDPRYSLTIAQPDNAVTLIVMLIVAIAIAVLVNSAGTRRQEALRATREAELLATFSGAVLSGEELTGLLERVRETYDQRAVSLVRLDGGVGEGGRTTRSVEGQVGEDPPQTTSDAQTSVRVAVQGARPASVYTDRRTAAPESAVRFELLLSGPTLGGRDRRVLTAVATQAASVVERRRLNAEASEARALSETDRLRRALLSAVSHDLRTPLAAVKVAASSLRSTDVSFSPEDTEELLATVEESADHLTALVENLLDSSRLAAGVISPELQPVYVGDVVGHVLAGIASYAGPEIDRVCTRIGPEMVTTDAGLLERALANVVDNAMRHSGAHDVEIETSLSAAPGADAATGTVLITVIDHGVGVDVGDRERLFGAFQRLGDRNESVGVGLGLSVAQGFVEAIDGTIEVGDTPGGGLTVTIEVPRWVPAEQSAGIGVGE
ncbi:sensor histidine kinase [Williamsia sterculiae]|uniref:sensor histidine kinase n=1 Tax=Williamsia sterculiae TaxID=1344003 RepID=UPI000970C2BC|nr:sensor histidine kinase KdpD [Williamsia sterculiae]